MTSRARDTIDVAISCQLETADALFPIKHHQCPLTTRQGIDDLVFAQFHVCEASLLLSAVVANESARAKSSWPKGLLAGQRRCESPPFRLNHASPLQER